MKKFKVLIIIIAAISLMLFQTIQAFAWIGDSYEDEEIAFESIMQEMKEDQGFVYESYTYQKAPLYNTNSELSGYVYDFNLDGNRNGYVLMIKLSNDWYEVTEIFIDTQSKFYGNIGINIYPRLLCYIALIDGSYYDLTLQQEITYNDVLYLEEQGFGYSTEEPEVIQWTEQVNYSSRTVSINQISSRIPAYQSGSTLGSNGCAVIAGTIVVGYWDMFKVNLISNYTPANVYNGIYYWKSESSTTTAVANELYVMMGTNTTGPGTTISQFKTGLTDYASTFGGYNTTYRSTMTSGSYDISKMLTEFAANRPVVMFMYPEYNFAMIGTYSGYDLIAQSDFTASHTMVAYGRQINTYYDSSNNQIRQITFLRVSGCASGAGHGWVRLNEGSLSINDSFSVEIS